MGVTAIMYVVNGLLDQEHEVHGLFKFDLFDFTRVYQVFDSFKVINIDEELLNVLEVRLCKVFCGDVCHCFFEFCF